MKTTIIDYERKLDEKFGKGNYVSLGDYCKEVILDNMDNNILVWNYKNNDTQTRIKIIGDLFFGNEVNYDCEIEIIKE